MECNKIKKIYEANQIRNFKLRTVEDLIKIHGIDYSEVEGFDNLSGDKKEVFKSFLVNIFNAYELESRTKITPIAIGYFEVTRDLVYPGLYSENKIQVSERIMSIDKNGSKKLLEEYINEEYKHIKVRDVSSLKYLKFEFTYCGNYKWVHVLSNGSTWF